LEETKKFLNLPDRINTIEGMTKTNSIPDDLLNKLSGAKAKGGIRNLKNMLDTAQN